MPVYVMTCEQCGRTWDVVRTISNRPTTMPCENGDCPGTAYRNLAVEHGGFRDTPGNWPMVSNALAVHSSQIKEAYEASVRAGVPTHFTEKGQPIFESVEHKTKYLASRGCVDLDGNRGGRSRSDGRREHEQLVG